MYFHGFFFKKLKVQKSYRQLEKGHNDWSKILLVSKITKRNSYLHRLFEKSNKIWFNKPFFFCCHDFKYKIYMRVLHLKKQLYLSCCPKKCLLVLPCFGSFFPAKLFSQTVLNFTYKFKDYTQNWRFWNKYCFHCVDFKNNVDFTKIFRLEVCERQCPVCSTQQIS